MSILNKLLPYIVILIFSIFTFKPILNDGFFPIHDNTQVARVYEMTKALKDGMFPVRWSEDLGYGYGYPLFNFYDPLPYYVGGFIGILGINALTSTKIMMILGIVMSGFSMYFFAKEYFGKYGGILSSLLYIYAPYHALDIYVRGDVAELFAYAFIPLIFYGLFKLSKQKEWKYLLISSVSYAGLITSHNLTAMFSLPFILLYAVYLLYLSKRKFQLFKYFSVSLILGGLVSSFYSIPAIFEMNFTNVISQVGGGADFRDHFVCLSQLWISPWAYGGSIKGCIDGLSFMVGKYHIILSSAIFALALIVMFWKKYERKFKVERQMLKSIIFFYILFLLSIFFTLDYSKEVWIFIKPMEFIQYPWRFLILATFFSSFIAGSLIYFIEKLFKESNARIILSLILIFTVVFVYSKFFVPQTTLSKSSNDFTNKYELTWALSKISDEFMPRNFSKPKSFYEIPDPSNLVTKDITARFISKKTQEVRLDLEVKLAGKYIFPIAYFPAWKAYLDGKSIEVVENKKGILLNLPAGNHTLVLRYQQTEVEAVSNLATIAGILILFTGIIYIKPKHE